MGRKSGKFSSVANFELKLASPFDARLLVGTKSDLINIDTWPRDDNTLYVYKGMIVSVADEGNAYMLVDPDKATNEAGDYSGWKMIGSSDEVMSTGLSGKINLSSIDEIRSAQSHLTKTNQIAFYLVTDTQGRIPSTESAYDISSDNLKQLSLVSPSASTNIILGLATSSVSLSPIGVNVGDLIALTRVKVAVSDLTSSLGISLSLSGEIELYQYKLLCMNDVKAPGSGGSSVGVMGLSSPWDKQQINKISRIESIANAALPKNMQLPSNWSENMNNALETGVYPWCTLGRPAGSTGAYTCIVKRTSTDDGSYNTIEQTAYGRQGELGKIFKRIIFKKKDGTDTQYGEWVEIGNPLLIVDFADILIGTTGYSIITSPQHELSNGNLVDVIFTSTEHSVLYKGPVAGKYIGYYHDDALYVRAYGNLYIFNDNYDSNTKSCAWTLSSVQKDPHHTTSDSCYTKIELGGQDINNWPQEIPATLFPNNGVSVFEITFLDYSGETHIGWGTEIFGESNPMLLIYIADRKITYSWTGTGKYGLVSNESVISDSSITKGHLSNDVLGLLGVCNENVQHAGDAVGVQLTCDRKVNIIGRNKVASMPYASPLYLNGTEITNADGSPIPYVKSLNDVTVIVEANFNKHLQDDGALLDRLGNNAVLLVSDGRLMDCRSYRTFDTGDGYPIVAYAPSGEQVNFYTSNDIGGWFVIGNVRSKFLLLDAGSRVTFTPVRSDDGNIYWYINNPDEYVRLASTIKINTYNYYDADDNYLSDIDAAAEHIIDCTYTGEGSSNTNGSIGILFAHKRISDVASASGYKGAVIELYNTMIDGDESAVGSNEWSVTDEI